ncbi:hypothetical protein [Nocardia thraciensis]
MVDQPSSGRADGDAATGRASAPRRVPGYIRALGVLVLLAAVAVMHAVVFAGGHARASGHAHAAEPTTAASSPTASDHAAATPSAIGSGHSETAHPSDDQMPDALIRTAASHSPETARAQGAPTTVAGGAMLAGPESGRTAPLATDSPAARFHSVAAPAHHSATFERSTAAVAGSPGGSITAVDGATAAPRDSGPGDSAAAPPAEHAAAPSGAGADCEGCGGVHGGMHACVFVLAALVLALGLAVLAWIGFGGRDAGQRAARPRAFRRARPPPWTVLSLSELAILRI